jgi:hypothetical protein
MTISLTFSRPNEPVQATAGAPCSFRGRRDSLLLGFVLAQSPAAVPDLFRRATMKTRLLAALLVGLAFPMIAGETTWEGTHRIVSSTEGRRTFNPQKSRTLCKLDVKDGKVTGTVSPFGVSFRGTNWSGCEELSGTIQDHVIEWKSKSSAERVTCRTVFHGVEDGDTLVGYFEQTWAKEGKRPVTYCGVVDLKKADGD